jgi:hypothetical protein
MAESLGDLKLSIFLDVSDAKTGAQELKGTISTLNTEASKTEKALDSVGKTIQSSTSNAFKTLNQDIKLAKAGVIEFGANTKIAGDDSMTYGQKLKDLVERKQVLTAQTRVASQQFMMMSGTIGIVGISIRNMINDIRTLDTTKQTPLELSYNIGQIGIQAIAILPALHELNKGLQAMGIFSGGLIGTLSTLVVGIASTALAFGLMFQGVKHSGDMFDRLGKVLSGQMSYWDALKQNIKDISFGLIDLTNNANDAADALKKAMLIGSSQDIEDAKQYQKMLSEGFSEEDSKLYIEMDKQERQRQDRLRENQENYRQELYKPSAKTGKGSKETEQLDKVQQLQKEIADLEKTITDYKAKGYNIDKESEELMQKQVELAYQLNKSQTGISDEMLSRTLEAVDKIETVQDKLGNDVDSRIEAEQKVKVILDAEAEVEEGMRKAEQERIERVGQEYDKEIGTMEGMLNLIGAINSDMAGGGDRWLIKLQQALQIMIAIAKLQKISAQGGEVGAGDILGLIGSFLPFLFLSSGGELPGFGGGDKVPAVLERGEGVINKFGMLKAKALFGENFLPMLNGIGSLPRIPGYYSNGGVVRAGMGNIVIEITGTMDGQDFLAKNVPGYNINLRKRTTS